MEKFILSIVSIFSLGGIKTHDTIFKILEFVKVVRIIR